MVIGIRCVIMLQNKLRVKPIWTTHTYVGILIDRIGNIRQTQFVTKYIDAVGRYRDRFLFIPKYEIQNRFNMLISHRREQEWNELKYM